jgi:hypothetical protein
MTGFDKVVAVEPGRIRVQAGALIYSALTAALKTGQQLMMYPSTMRSATVGGYLGGGFAGIGSVRHGIIRDSGMIKSLRIMTVEEQPRTLTLAGDDVGIALVAAGVAHDHHSAAGVLPQLAGHVVQAGLVHVVQAIEVPREATGRAGHGFGRRLLDGGSDEVNRPGR